MREMGSCLTGLSPSSGSSRCGAMGGGERGGRRWGLGRARLFGEGGLELGGDDEEREWLGYLYRLKGIGEHTTFLKAVRESLCEMC